MSQGGDQRVWIAMVFASGIADLIGAVRASPRLHWTQRAARKEAQTWAAEMGLGEIVWGNRNEEVVIGRTPGHAVVLRRIPLPLCSPEEEMP
jgi:hypothetical protein